MPDAIDWVLVQRYCAGECTPAEEARLDRWVGEDTGRRQSLESLQTIWNASRALASPGDTHASFARARERLGFGVGVGAPSAVVAPRTGVGRGTTGLRALIPAGGARAARPLVALAAAIVLALGLAMGVGRHRVGFGGAAGREYATAAGQRLSVTLVDGTQLTLAPASKVRLASDYGRGMTGRAVELEGEAYFKVVHDAAHPFAVRAHGAVAKDVGTAFDVRAYPEDVEARIVVAEGAVAVSTAGACPGLGTDTGRASASTAAGDGGPCGVEARAGDVATVGENRVAVTHGVDATGLTGWRRGELVFRQTPVHDVLQELQRWYDLKFVVPDSGLASMRLTATYAGESMAEVLDAAGRALNARVEWRGRLVTMVPAPSGTRAGLAAPGGHGQ